MRITKFENYEKKGRNWTTVKKPDVPRDDAQIGIHKDTEMPWKVHPRGIVEDPK